jgi:hypothetical protein
MIVSNYKPFTKNTLRAFFDLQLDSGLLILGCTLHQKNANRWIGLPAKPYTDKNGVISYQKILDFRDRKTADRFRDLVLRAIDAQTKAA